MKKKIFIVFVLFIIAFIIVNLSYDFFMADGVKSIREKIAYRKFYNEREILENVNNENALTHGDIIVELKEKSYDKETGKVRLFFVFNNIKDIGIFDMYSMIRVHDGSKIYFNKAVGENKTFVDDIDYFVYNYHLYSMLSIKGFEIDDIDFDEKFFFMREGDTQELEIILDIGKEHQKGDIIYVEFLDLLFSQGAGIPQKAFDYLGEFRFKIEL
ncbi:MAG: hypothetical protein IKJ36_00660 [Clostridia bacterium]|nr:hypothetical protein [Clostridia bacterium]